MVIFLSNGLGARIYAETIVVRTLPCNVRPINGVLRDLEPRLSGVTVHGTLDDDGTRELTYDESEPQIVPRPEAAQVDWFRELVRWQTAAKVPFEDELVTNTDGKPEFKSENDWMVKQFAKLGVQLEIRATDYNQFQDKMLKGKQQIFWWGWLADYPDAENFLFLLYGPNAKYPNQGENTANYSNPEYDRLYRLMQTMDDSPEKQKVMDQMVAIVREDAPWAWGYWPYVALAFQPWAHNGKPSIVVRDLAKYYRIDPAMRVAKQAEWNHPVRWPLALIVLALALMVGLAWRGYRVRQLATAKPKAGSTVPAATTST